MGRLLGRQRGGRHAGLGVGLQHDDAVLAPRLVPAEVGAADAPAAQRPVRGDRHLAKARGHGRRQVGRDHMSRAAFGILGLVVVPAVGQDVGDRQRALLAGRAHDRDGELAPGGIGLDHQPLGHLPRQRGGPIRPGGHHDHANRGTFVHGLHHIGRRHRVGGGDVVSRGDDMRRDRQARGGQRLLGAGLVHRQRRGQHARMGVGKAHPFEEALHGAVLAEAAMKGVEHRERSVRAHRRQPRGEVPPGIDHGHVVTSLPQGSRAFTRRGQGHLSFRRESACQHRHAGSRLVRHRPLSPLLPEPSDAALDTARPPLFAGAVLVRSGRAAHPDHLPL